MPSSLLSPGAPDYDENRAAFNTLLDQRPAKIATPTSAVEAVAAVRAARDEGLRVAVQRTGHGADPLGGLEGALLVRTGGLGGVEIDAGARRARVGAGPLWGDLVPPASEQGLAALHGSTPTVGIAGYLLNGGVSWYGRKHGLACNSVTAVEIVTADGEQRRVDGDNDADLFWALRGAGGDFGLVTAIEFELQPIASVYAGALFFPLERAAEALGTWLELTDTLPEEATSVGRVLAFPPLPEIPEPLRGNSFAVIEMVLIGDEATGGELLAPLRALGPRMDTFAVQPPAGIAELHMDPPEPGPAIGDGLLLGDLDEKALEAWLAVVGPGTNSPLVSVELRHTGGAMGRPDPGGGALDQLPGKILQFAVGIVPDPALRDPVLDRVLALEQAMEPWSAGRYRSFSLNALSGPNTFSAETAERLAGIKQAYDPDNLFLSNHPVVSA
jgi:FAD/FMN-containing dehydrogenase